MAGGVVLPLALAAARTLKKGVSLKSDRCEGSAANPTQVSRARLTRHAEYEFERRAAC